MSAFITRRGGGSLGGSVASMGAFSASSARSYTNIPTNCTKFIISATSSNPYDDSSSKNHICSITYDSETNSVTITYIVKNGTAFKKSSGASYATYNPETGLVALNTSYVFIGSYSYIAY